MSKLLAKAKRIQAKVNAPILEENNRIVEAKKNVELTKENRIETLTNDVVKALEEFNGLMIQPVVWYQPRGVWCVSKSYTRPIEIKLVPMSEYFSRNNKEVKKIYLFSYSPEDSVTIDANAAFPYQLKLDMSNLEKSGEYLTNKLEKDHGWKERIVKPIEKSFITVTDLKEYLEEFFVTVIDLKAEEEKVLQSEKCNLLNQYLDRTDAKFESKHFTSASEKYNVLNKAEVLPYFINLIKQNVIEYFDVGLLSKHSGLTANEIQGLRFAIKDDNTLVKVLKSVIELDAYAKELADTYAFDKYVKAFNKHYIVKVK